ncbi:hypothetical protein H5410_029864 [Solanum commersonii]|uniref:Uncharacterized protein n=1 Tax=Solanum commersonii TaxID=4109 RepID=A0A9J5YHL0_SOLCO|nr:hypothetical protein H5410_029864 [Solanum commersonii]
MLTSLQRLETVNFAQLPMHVRGTRKQLSALALKSPFSRSISLLPTCQSCALVLPHPACHWGSIYSVAALVQHLAFKLV